jgi:hypothetical protein
LIKKKELRLLFFALYVNQLNLLKMENVKFEKKGNILTITVDLSKKGTVSSSGKSMVIASTRGNAPVEGTDVIVGLNVYKKV